MTRQECIAMYEAWQRAQLADRPVLTPLGRAIVARARLARALEALSVGERRELAEIPQSA